MVKEEDLPIDIYYNKLQDWLIDRRHCNTKWQDQASSIREKINTAIQDMPPNEEITHLLSGTYINYFHCKRIIELLKDCGEGSTNFFGQYSSKRMKDWQEIIQLYVQDNVYLAEAAHMLMRNVNFEIPALKRQIGKSQQTQKECIRKGNDCKANSLLFKDKYLHVCKQMGITGDNPRKELVQLVDKLPEIFMEIAEKVKSLDKVITYYRSFVKFVVHNKTTEINDITPLLKFVIDSGNATVYQWKTGEVPSKVEENIQKVDLEAMAQISDQDVTADQEDIDWGADDGAIDYGDADIDYGEIDYGDLGENDGDNIDISISAITIEDAGLENPEGGVATGEEARSVLENTATRNVFIDELMEVEAFLEQRIIEMSSEADMITVNQLQSAPEIIQYQTKQKLQSMLSKVSSFIRELTTMKMQNLYLIQNSPRYVDRIVESLEQKLKISKNLLHQVEALQQRHKNAVELQLETEPKHENLVKKTKVLQKQIEEEISRRYKNRKVNVMGEINTI